MKKCIALLLTLMLVFCSSPLSVYAIDAWTAKNMNEDVLRFMLELNEVHYFDEVIPYSDVLHLTVKAGEPDISSARVYQLVHYFSSVSDNGLLYESIGGESASLYESLGYANYQACRELASANPKPTDFEQVALHEYVEALNTKDSRVSKYSGYGSGYQTDGKGHGILQSDTAVVKALSLGSTVYWFVLPGYNDYSLCGDTMRLFDYNNHKVSADFSVSSCLKAYAKNSNANDLRSLSLWRYDVPGYIYTAEQLQSMTEEQLLKEFRRWKQESNLYWNNFYKPYYTLEDINRANALFEEYIGYGSDELYAYFSEE